MPQLTRRCFLTGATALGAGAATAGCGRGDADAVTFFVQGRPDEIATRERVIDEFQRRHPGIRVRLVLSGPDPLQQMLTYCAGGKCPDVLMAWELLYSGLAERGVLLDLNTLLRRDPGYAAQLRVDSSPALYDTFAFRGGQYALPEQWSGVFLYYNTEIFARAGVPVPPGRWTQPWTFAQFLDTADRLTVPGDGGRAQQWGFVDAWVPYLSAGVFGMNNGVPWFAPAVDPVRCLMGDDRFIDAVQFYADLAARHRVSPRIGRSAGLQAWSGPDLFTGGRAAMMLGGHWLYSELVGAGVPFDIAVLPVGPSGGAASRSDVGTTGLSIAADSPRRAAAWEFVKFATGPVGQAIIAESGLFVPVLKSAVATPGFIAAHRHVHNQEVFSGGLDHSSQLPVAPRWGEVDAALQRVFDDVLAGRSSAAALRGAAVDIDRILAGDQR